MIYGTPLTQCIKEIQQSAAALSAPKIESQSTDDIAGQLQGEIERMFPLRWREDEIVDCWREGETIADEVKDCFEFENGQLYQATLGQFRTRWGCGEMREAKNHAITYAAYTFFIDNGEGAAKKQLAEFVLNALKNLQSSEPDIRKMAWRLPPRFTIKTPEPLVLNEWGNTMGIECPVVPPPNAIRCELRLRIFLGV